MKSWLIAMLGISLMYIGIFFERKSKDVPNEDKIEKVESTVTSVLKLFSIGGSLILITFILINMQIIPVKTKRIIEIVKFVIVVIFAIVSAIAILIAAKMDSERTKKEVESLDKKQ